MSTVAETMDPVLKRLLDELPHEDPDREMATVWIAFCEGRHKVPLNEPTRIDFGPWFGPKMRCSDIIVHAIVHGRHETGHIDWDCQWVHPHDYVDVTITVMP